MIDIRELIVPLIPLSLVIICILAIITTIFEADRQQRILEFNNTLINKGEITLYKGDNQWRLSSPFGISIQSINKLHGEVMAWQSQYKIGKEPHRALIVIVVAPHIRNNGNRDVLLLDSVLLDGCGHSKANVIISGDLNSIIMQLIHCKKYGIYYNGDANDSMSAEYMKDCGIWDIERVRTRLFGVC